MTLVNQPLLPNHANFVITWNGMDWSGFRTLQECKNQFEELENKHTSDEDLFQVVER